MRNINLVVLGDGGVGKSSLIIQYVRNRFVVKYEATIEDVYQKAVEVDAQPTVLTIVDTSGQDVFGGMRYKYIRKCHGVILVYSVIDAESFSHIKAIHTQLCRARGSPSIPCVLVGNKVDEVKHRAVSSEEASKFAAQFMYPLLEVTAKDHSMAAAVFETLVRSIRGEESWLECRSPNVIFPPAATISEVRDEVHQLELPSVDLVDEHEEESPGIANRKKKSGCTML
ncbi:ras-like small GTPase, putative [Trypanosoma equiperdum]|uniref:GTP binding protein n=5 Tax=Trypanozoon TaxID=39700 RepID=Q385G5_TRYB2|nr:GTP binding protein [Trypanosoma brucei gambiense DAL972]XP_828678.1 GTP-binding protein [Trypanosoma brucei brucei TREU927]RHW67057.1 ras-like small GTPase [Trypanosoma brucei equiperdum]CAA05774.1 GTP binding protein [Trypanosoma brucei brucei]SCU64282.1 ras-like small GTPase, putative [Trypanosoma equiperdum]EAN79566.1 GTP binding protein [Trypanosoma brucei brucei TREU927]CBH17560.1 GTP binding protein [Trypanosoma brucei gambiense DAL972]|eukprot:XP_011779824.1 GTP binding protein [Trypanosoma brucei gambiense DAL972]